MKLSTRYSQSGVAIITVLLMVALATITVVSMTTRQRLDIRRTANQQSLQQAKALALAGEKFAAATLMRDKIDIKAGKTDSLDDDWAQSLPPVPVDQSTIKGCVFDLTGHYNLNNLVTEKGSVNRDELTRFIRLLKYLNIDVNKASAIVDWIDKDSEPFGADGAESDYYSSLEPPYRPGNRLMASISELKMVKGFAQANEDEKADYDLLIAHISALPEYTKINVNTATPAVIASIDDSLVGTADKVSRWSDTVWELYPECENIFDISQLVSKAKESALSEEDKNPYDSVAEFLADTGLSTKQSANNSGAEDGASQGENNMNLNEKMLDVQSNYFQIRIEVDTGEVSLAQFSLVKRSNKGANTVLQRSRNVF